jgi:hypothetical protein
MIDVKRMISMIGKTVEDLISVGLLAVNKKPKPRYSGDDELVLDMVREGVLLAFDRKTKKLIRISLTLLDIDKPKYHFPNELPRPLIPFMTKEYVYQKMGKPYESKGPIEFMGDILGVVEHYRLDRNIFGEISLLLYYTDDQQSVESLSFMYTDNVLWGELGS